MTIPKIFVRDSHNTELIKNRLNKLLGDKIECFTETDNDLKFNLFFLSAKQIIYGEVDESMLKKRFGTSNAKVVAMSTMTCFLDKLNEDNSFCVDFTLNKIDFFKSLVFDGESEKELPLIKNINAILKSVDG